MVSLNKTREVSTLPVTERELTVSSVAVFPSSSAQWL